MPFPPPNSCDACRSSSGSKTKIKSLTLRYTGSNTGASNNDQGDKWGFTGNPGSFGGDQVTIRAYSDKGTYGTYTVSPGGTFVVSAWKFEANSYFEFQGTGSRVYFHTSCSFPIRVGDRFASLEVVCYTNDQGGSCNDCAPAVPSCVNDVSQCPACTMCVWSHKPTQLSLTFVGGGAALSNSQGGRATFSGDSISASTASISCTGSRGSVGSGQVGMGQSIVLSGLNNQGSDITCRVTGGGATQTFVMHTSCSVPLNVRDRFGAIEITGFVTQHTKGYNTRSSSDPNTCPPCELCCEMAELDIPQPITLDCDGAMSNHVRLQQWISAARCVTPSGRNIPVHATPPLLSGDNTCAVSSTVTWTCTDECGRLHRDSAVFAIIDRAAPVVSSGPVDQNSECDPANIQNVPANDINSWLASRGGMTANDLCQEAQPCAGTAFAGVLGTNAQSSGSFVIPDVSDGPGQVETNNNFANTAWSGSAYETPNTNYAAPNVQPYSGSSGNVPYYKQSSRLQQADDTAENRDTGGSYSSYGYASTSSQYSQSYACAFCPTVANAVCASGVEYQSPCHAHCAGITAFLPGRCGSQMAYNNGVVTSYSNGNCACASHQSACCSANGQRTYRNPCYAMCAGDFNYINGPCQYVAAAATANHPRYVPAGLWGGAPYWLGQGYVGQGDSRWISRECQGDHRYHDHCYINFGAPGYVGPYSNLNSVAAASTQHPYYVPASLWGAQPYWMGPGHITQGDPRYISNECQGSHRNHANCYIRYGSPGWTAPYANLVGATQAHPYYVPASLWGGSPYWMGEGYVQQGSQRWMSRECQGSHQYHSHCYIRYGSPGYIGPVIAAYQGGLGGVSSTQYPHYVPGSLWGGNNYWMGQGHVAQGDSRYMSRECQGSRRNHDHCYVRYGSPGWVAPYQPVTTFANNQFPHYVPAAMWGGQPYWMGQGYVGQGDSRYLSTACAGQSQWQYRNCYIRHGSPGWTAPYAANTQFPNYVPASMWGGQPYWMGAGHVQQGDSRYMTRECGGTSSYHSNCYIRHGVQGWVAPYADNTAHPHYVPGNLWGGSPYWMGAGYVTNGDSRYMSRECQGSRRNHQHCYYRHGSAGWVAPYINQNTDLPHYVPGDLWGASPYWMGTGYVAQSDSRWLSTRCSGQQRYNNRCYIPHGSPGWTAPYAAQNTRFPDYVPASMWGGNPYWMGQGHVVQGDSRYMSRECQGSHRNHDHCYVRHGSPGWVAPYQVAVPVTGIVNSRFPHYVPGNLWGATPYWMGSGHVGRGDTRYMSRECRGSHRNHDHCYIRHGAQGWVAPYQVAQTANPHYVPAALWNAQPYWMGTGHVAQGDSRWMSRQCGGTAQYRDHCFIRHGEPGWVAPYAATPVSAHPHYVPGNLWGGNNYWMGQGHVAQGDSRYMSRECQGSHRNHDHCYVRYGNPGWVAPYSQVTAAAFTSPSYPHYVPAGLWGGSNYWMGQGYVGQSDARWVSRTCGTSPRHHSNCHIPHGAPGWTAPYAANTRFPHYVPAGLWGAQPYWMGQGYVGQGDPRNLATACSGQYTYQFANCYIPHGNPGWVAPYVAQNTQFPHYVPSDLWGGQPYWMGSGHVGRGDLRWQSRECQGSHRNHDHCYIRHGSVGWVAPYAVANANYPYYVPANTWGGSPYWMGTGHVVQSDSRWMSRECQGSRRKHQHCYYRHGSAGWVAPYQVAVPVTTVGNSRYPNYVPAGLWGGSPYWMGQGHVVQGDSRYMSRECRGSHRKHDHCYVRHGSPGWVAPYQPVTAFANNQFPNYVPATLWGGQPYWMGQGYVGQGDSRYMSRECRGSHRKHDHCYIRHGSPGWTAPYAANTHFPHYVPAAQWGGQPYWMGAGYVGQDDSRNLATACSGQSTYQFANCYIPHGNPGWVAPYVAQNTQFPHYVPGDLWGTTPYWMGTGHVGQGDSRYMSRECQGAHRLHDHCYIRHGSVGWVAPYQVLASNANPHYVPASLWGASPYWMGAGHVAQGDSRWMSSECQSSRQYHDNCYIRHGNPGWVAPYNAGPISGHPHYVPGSLWGGNNYWMGQGHVAQGDSRYMSRECQGSHRNHDHCYIRYGSAGWTAPFQSIVPVVANQFPHYVPAGLWGGSPYWMGAGYIGRGDNRWMSRECAGSHRRHDHCHIRHGSVGWTAPYAANTQFPRYVPASLWGGSPYWMGQGHVQQSDSRWLGSECAGTDRWQWRNCHIRHGNPGWTAPYQVTAPVISGGFGSGGYNSVAQFPHYVPASLWGGAPYWMGTGHVGYGDTRWMTRECTGSHRRHNHCHIRHGSVGWIAPYQLAAPIGGGFGGGGYGAVAAVSDNLVGGYGGGFLGNGLVGGYGGGGFDGSTVQTTYSVQPHYVPAATWGGSPYWMGTGYVSRDDRRWMSRECKRSRRHHDHCFIRHGSAGWTAPFQAANTQFPSYVPGDLWGGQPYWMSPMQSQYRVGDENAESDPSYRAADGYVTSGDPRYLTNECTGRHYNSNDCFIRPGSTGYVAPYQVTAQAHPHHVPASLWGGQPYWMGAGHVEAGDPRYLNTPCSGTVQWQWSNCYVRHGQTGWVAPYQAMAASAHPHYVPAAVWGGAPYWMGSGHVQLGDQRYLNTECSGLLQWQWRNCYVSYGTAGWVAPYTAYSSVAVVNQQTHPHYVPASYWGGNPYWLGQGYVTQGDSRYLSSPCSGSVHWQYRNCYIPHGASGYVGPSFAADTQHPHYVPASLWGGNSYWMGAGYVQQGDSRWMGTECTGTHQYHDQCYIRYGAPGWIAPGYVENTAHPHYVPASLWGGNPYWMGEGYVQQGDSRWMGSECLGEHRQYTNCYIRHGASGWVAPGFLGDTSTGIPNELALATEYGCDHCETYDQICCGNNGVEYASPCHAACAGIYNFHVGTCTVYAPATNCGHDLDWSHSVPQFGPCGPGSSQGIAMQGGGTHAAPLQCAAVTFTASDACGNSVSRAATYKIVDSTAPVISGGQDLVWPCDSECNGYENWESDARMFLNQWAGNNGCLEAEDCSAQIAWTPMNVPTGDLCGTSGEVTFRATDAFGNAATHSLSYSFPIPPQTQCFICGQTTFGQSVKASLQELTVVYESTNPNAVSIRVYDTDGKRGIEPGSFVNVRPGDEIRSFVGFQGRSSYNNNAWGSSNKFPTNTAFSVSGGDAVTLHTSCSVPLYAGQTFSLGNGGSIRITGFRTDVGSSDTCPGSGRTCAYPNVCGAPPPAFPAPPPTTPPTTPPCVPTIRYVCPYNKANLRELIFKYVATNTLSNRQEGKASVSGDVSGNQVSVSCTGGGSQAVALNGIYTLGFDGQSDSSTECSIVGSGGQQHIEIHTSCSKGLNTGDQFGHLLVVGFRWADGTYVNNDNCQVGGGSSPVGPYQNWQNGGTDGAGYVPPSMAAPTFPPTFPPAVQNPTQTMAQLLGSRAEYSIFYELLTSSNILNALSAAGPFTVLAPTNTAFADLGEATLAALRADTGRLASVLLFHIIGGSATAASLTDGQTLTSFNGLVNVNRVGPAGAVTFSSAASIVAAGIVEADIPATNGVAHSIDAVLTPFIQSSPSYPPTFGYIPPTPPPSTNQFFGGSGTCPYPMGACHENTRITSLTFRYVGKANARLNHRQNSWRKGFVNDLTLNDDRTVKISLLSYKRASWFTETNPRGIKFDVNIGDEFTIVGNPNKRNKLANALTFKVGNAKIKIATNCAAHIGIGDQFGPVIVTAWRNFKGHECSDHGSSASEQDSNTALSAGSGSSSEGMSSVTIVGVGVGVVAAVVIVAAAIIVRRKKAANGNWATASSQE